MKKESDPKDDDLIENSTIIILITLILFFSIFIIHRLFPNQFGNIDNAKWGQFGDFYGGVLGTIFAAIAAVLVYRTYKTQSKTYINQLEQFELQKKESNQNLVDNLYDRISSDIDGLEITYIDNTGTLVTIKGTTVLYNFTEFYPNQNTVLNQLALILISFEHLFKLTKDSTYKWERQLQINQDRNYLLYYTKVVWPFHTFYRLEWDKLINEWEVPHPDSLGTRTRFEKLLKESYDYLLARKLVGLTDDKDYLKIIRPNDNSATIP